jgi:hypothetical protein
VICDINRGIAQQRFLATFPAIGSDSLIRVCGSVPAAAGQYDG